MVCAEAAMEQPWSTLQFLPHRKGLAACRKPVGDGQQPLLGSNWGMPQGLGGNTDVQCPGIFPDTFGLERTLTKPQYG